MSLIGVNSLAPSRLACCRSHRSSWPHQYIDIRVRSFARPSDANCIERLLTTAIMAATAQGAPVSKRRKFVADGVFYAELNEFFQRELAEEGYSGVEVRVTPTVTDISMIPLAPSWSSACTFLILDSHPCNAHARSPRRARPSHP